MGWFDKEKEEEAEEEASWEEGPELEDREQATIISSYETARREKNGIIVL
jgi:hypothetical protein